MAAMQTSLALALVHPVIPSTVNKASGDCVD
jgi:hypothetical protein